jgi:hypothetical protein
MEPNTEREVVIDMDAIAARGGDQPRPEFYYTAESQQTRYTCDHCGEFNDIRGRYGYCASCGWRNNAQFLKRSSAEWRTKLNSGEISPAETVKSTVSEFDACCRDIVVQTRQRIPMKPSRRADLERLIFHDVESATIGRMKSMFDIDMLRGVGGELAFTKMMMHRRHVYEHNAGVADERYVCESGDETVQAGILIRETQANAHRLINALVRIIENLDADFHEIFPPTEWPLKHHQAGAVRQ